MPQGNYGRAIHLPQTLANEDDCVSAARVVEAWEEHGDLTVESVVA
jgi:hypothetical protein